MKPDTSFTTVHMDTNETTTFIRELSKVKSKTYDRRYPDLAAFSGNFPISTEAGKLAENIIVQSFDVKGVAKIIANYADDLPRVDVVADEITVPIRPVADAYGYNIQEAQLVAAGTPLNVRKSNAAKDAIMRELNRLFFKARPSVDSKLTGILYQPNVTIAQAPNNAAATSRSWDNKTPDEILADLNGIVTGIIDLTGGIESPDTIAIPHAKYAKISSTPRSANSDTTILSYFLANSPYVKKVVPMVEMKDVTPRPSGQGGSANIMMAYRNDSDKLTLELAMPFEQMPVETRGLEYIVVCLARTAASIVYYPLSIAIWEGI